MITLTDEERKTVESFIRRGKANARNITRAHILLKSAESWSIERIASTYGVSEATCRGYFSHPSWLCPLILKNFLQASK
jgi:hypothetical protein